MPSTSRPVLIIPARNLRLYRLRAVLTQEQLAAKSGVAVARIRQIEGSKNLTVQPGTVGKLANALGCTPQELSEVVEIAAATEEAAS